jgi:hypothetical protein
MILSWSEQFAHVEDWSTPEINYALNRTTVAKFRHRLLTGEDTFTRADLWSASA